MKEIQLTHGKVALVDDDDYERLVAMGKWKVSDTGYVNKTIHVRYEGKKRIMKSIRMHRIIMNAPDGFEVDHKDGNLLNNQKRNLRLSTRSQNMMNRTVGANSKTGFKGVVTYLNKYKAQIKLNGKSIKIGYFTCPIEAARAYNAAAIKYHGEFAKLNPL
jgi:hypothetical protein